MEKIKVLFLCDFSRSTANTIYDHATSFYSYSKFDYYYFNPVNKSKPLWLLIDNFDVIVLHYSIYILSDYYLDCTWRNAITRSKAVKIQFIQDEYRTINAFHKRQKELDIHILFTCVPVPEIEKAYPKEKLPGMVKINNLTGYVPEYLENKKPDFSKIRTIDVGYRSRGTGYFWLGKLFHEKGMIGEVFKELVPGKGIRCDISCREEDRIYGDKWVEFLENSYCTLGTESGANVFDFTGEIETNVKKYCASHPHTTFNEVWELFLKDVDGNIKLNQISPRFFEAIGCGCTLILFEGEYSGILKPGIHYIELKKDFSNIQEVCEKINDKTYLKKMAAQTYNDIIASGKYSYRTFVNFFDNKIENYFSQHRIKPLHLSTEHKVSRISKQWIATIANYFNYILLIFSQFINEIFFNFKGFVKSILLSLYINSKTLFKVVFLKKIEKEHPFFTEHYAKLKSNQFK